MQDRLEPSNTLGSLVRLGLSSGQRTTLTTSLIRGVFCSALRSDMQYGVVQLSRHGLLRLRRRFRLEVWCGADWAGTDDRRSTREGATCLAWSCVPTLASDSLLHKTECVGGETRFSLSLREAVSPCQSQCDCCTVDERQNETSWKSVLSTFGVAGPIALLCRLTFLLYCRRFELTSRSRGCVVDDEDPSGNVFFRSGFGQMYFSKPLQR